MVVVLTDIPIDVAQAYLDDLPTGGKDFKDYLRNLELVLSRLSDHGLKVSAKKCELFKERVDYLGHSVGRDGISPLVKNLTAILEFPIPKTVKQLRTFNRRVKIRNI